MYTYLNRLSDVYADVIKNGFSDEIIQRRIDILLDAQSSLSSDDYGELVGIDLLTYEAINKATRSRPKRIRICSRVKKKSASNTNDTLSKMALRKCYDIISRDSLVCPQELEALKELVNNVD